LFGIVGMHIAEHDDDYVTSSELEAVQTNLEIVGQSVWRLSNTPSDTQDSPELVFDDLESINSGDAMDYMAEIDELKLAMADVNQALDTKAEQGSVYTTAAMDGFLEGKADVALTYTMDDVDGLVAGALTRAEGDALAELVDTKADAESTYTRAEVDQLAGNMLTRSEGEELATLLDGKADAADVNNKQENLLAVVNIVEVLSGERLEDAVATTFFTEDVDLELDLALSPVDFANFEEAITEDLAEVRGEVEGLEEDLVLKADASVMAAALEEKVDEEAVSGLVDDALTVYDIPGLQAAILLAQEQLGSLEDEVALKGDAEEIAGQISVLDQMVSDVKLDLSNLPEPIHCAWSGKRTTHGEQSSCSDDLEIYCENNLITLVRMKCDN